MFEPVKELQVCFGLSLLLVSGGGAWSMISGSVVQFRVAGANFSVNKKLEKVELVRETLEDTATKLKREPGVSRRRIQAIEQQLELLTQPIEATEQEVYQDLDNLVRPGVN